MASHSTAAAPDQPRYASTRQGFTYDNRYVVTPAWPLVASQPFKYITYIYVDVCVYMWVVPYNKSLRHTYQRQSVRVHALRQVSLQVRDKRA